MATYLDLVNEALRESGSTLDQLTSATFPSPGDPLYTKFQQWVAQAWEDIQTDRRDWQFMQSTGVTYCLPKIEVYACYSSTTPAAADFAGVEFRLHNAANPVIFTGEALTGTLATTALITLTEGEGDLTFLDAVSAQSGFVLDPSDFLTNSSGSVTCRFRRWGRYDLSEAVATARDASTDIAELKLDSLAISDEENASGQNYGSSTYTKLNYMPYSKWLAYGYDRPKRIGRPTTFTVSNNGSVEFYPPMDEPYHVYFEYTKTPQTFTTADTGYALTPTGLPARFHKAISWRALMYYGEYDGISRIYNIAKNRYAKFEYEMVRDLLPEVSIGYDARRF